MILRLLAVALPGFVTLLPDVDPNLPQACATCHAAKPGDESAASVTPRGFELYDLVKEAGKRHEIEVPVVQAFDRTDFNVFGDTRTNPDAHRQVVNRICAEGPQMVVHTGDMVTDGSIASLWTEAMSIESCLIQPKILQPACGNHEGSYCTNNPVRRALGNDKKYYSFDFRGLTFVALDSNDLSAAQLAWFDALPAGKTYVPFFHHPPYATISGHTSDMDVRQKLVPRFKARGIKLVLNGHNHGYDRAVSDGITYVTVGGGGAPLYPCGPSQSYTKACVSDYSYVSCAVEGTKVSCVAKLGTSGRTIDGFDVTL
jgi:hypothetical protein